MQLYQHTTTCFFSVSDLENASHPLFELSSLIALCKEVNKSHPHSPSNESTMNLVRFLRRTIRYARDKSACSDLPPTPSPLHTLTAFSTAISPIRPASSSSPRHLLSLPVASSACLPLISAIESSYILCSMINDMSTPPALPHLLYHRLDHVFSPSYSKSSSPEMIGQSTFLHRLLRNLFARSSAGVEEAEELVALTSLCIFSSLELFFDATFESSYFSSPACIANFTFIPALSS